MLDSLRGYRISVGTEFTAITKDATSYRYKFIEIDDSDPCYSIHLKNLDDGTDTYVEFEWFKQRKIIVHD